MLEELTVKNLGTIEEARVNFSPGLTVLTGETGAGKTMLLTALHLLTGKRSDASVVRTSASEASVEGAWQIRQPEVLEAIEATGAVVEEHELFINRTVRNDGRARAVLGGKTTPTKVLSSVAKDLLTIHGQADQLKLKDPAAALFTLDTYGSQTIEPEKKKYAVLYKKHAKARKMLEEAQSSARARHYEYASLQDFLKAYETLQPQDGEIATLLEAVERLSHLDVLRAGTQEAHAVLTGQQEDSIAAEQVLTSTLRTLRPLSAYDTHLEPVVTALETVLDAFSEAETLLDNYCHSWDEDTLETLYASQERLQALKAFEKKYALRDKTWSEEFRKAEERAEAIAPEKFDEQKLSEEVSKLHALLTRQAAKLTQVRQAQAATLTSKISEELQKLSMGGAAITLAFTPTSLTASGQESVTWQLQQKQGELRPLAKAASGGELSRIMLAIELVLASVTHPTTFVFDEIDAGVGGETALELGKRLAVLASTAQVIVVTHLPQVACFASAHLKVTKTTATKEITTKVSSLEAAAKTKEIARMLSGQSSSKVSLQHADELLAMAAAYRKAIA